MHGIWHEMQVMVVISRLQQYNARLVAIVQLPLINGTMIKLGWQTWEIWEMVDILAKFITIDYCDLFYFYSLLLFFIFPSLNSCRHHSTINKYSYVRAPCDFDGSWLITTSITSDSPIPVSFNISGWVWKFIRVSCRYYYYCIPQMT